MTEEPFDPTPPHAAAIVESLRAFGYDLPTAIADVVDNSISAGARNIWLHFEWDGVSSIVTVTDDGHGMTADELIEAMRLGGVGPRTERKPHDLGRFGLGLKTASLSQCRRLTVRSRRAGGSLETRCWDLDLIAVKNDWRLLRAADAGSEPHFSRLTSLPHGTTVLWQNLDRLTRDQRTDNPKHHDRFLERIEGVRRHLGLVFHRLMVGRDAVRLFVNNREVQPWDPFLSDHPATLLLPSDPLRLRSIPVSVRPYVLPHISKLTKTEHDQGEGTRGWLAHQGFYIYRRNRLLVAGDWLGFGWTKDEHLKLARIAIDLPNALDHDWQINVTKSRATPPPELRDDLKRIALRTREEAKKVYTYRGARLVPQKNSERVHLWGPVAKHDRVFYQINREHPLVRHALDTASDPAALRALLALLQETIPLQHIAITATEKPASQPEPFESSHESEIMEAMSQLYRLFCAAGHSPEESKRRLSAQSPFDQFPGLLSSIDSLS
jgi:Histidine kinase-, DNA gyrase B-, and HSP90-like ATPase